MASLSGKVAIVTGSSSGIGRAIAERLAEEGAIVVVNYAKRAELARDVVSEIQAKGRPAMRQQSHPSSSFKELVRVHVSPFIALHVASVVVYLGAGARLFLGKH